MRVQSSVINDAHAAELNNSINHASFISSSKSRGNEYVGGGGIKKR